MDILIIDNKNYIIDDCIEIGQGGNWKVYSAKILPKLQFPLIETDDIVIKIPTNGCIKTNKKNRDLIKKAGIPCLEFMMIGQYKGGMVIVTENLNYRNKSLLYVSSNYHPSNKNNCFLEHLSFSKRIPCKNEEILSNNKLDSIKNENEVIKELRQLADKCTQNKIMISNDVFFFGVDIIKQTIEDILIADYDCIYPNTENYLETKNLDSVNTMFQEFKMHYVKTD